MCATNDIVHLQTSSGSKLKLWPLWNFPLYPSLTADICPYGLLSLWEAPAVANPQERSPQICPSCSSWFYTLPCDSSHCPRVISHRHREGYVSTRYSPVLWGASTRTGTIRLPPFLLVDNWHFLPFLFHRHLAWSCSRHRPRFLLTNWGSKTWTIPFEHFLLQSREYLLQTRSTNQAQVAQA